MNLTFIKILSIFLLVSLSVYAQKADTLLYKEIDDINVFHKQSNFFGMTYLKSVEGTAIYEGKKSEVILIDALVSNKATNNARQTFAKVPGLNIWESDCAGLQLGIAARGLSPNRTSNFNTRINGYDLSADALGYPEMYYSPPIQSLEKIEIVRGAASLQYGTQFGGMVNFVTKQGPKDKKIETNTENTLGSFGFFNTFNSIGGTVNKTNYYTYYQYKRGDCWRPNSGFELHNGFLKISQQFTEKLKVGLEYTYMGYLAQQAGGLTDMEFLTNPRQSKRARNWFRINWNLAAINTDYTFSENTKINIRLFGLYAARESLGNLLRIDRIDDPNLNRTLISGNYANIGAETRLLHRYQLLGGKHIFLIGNRTYRGLTTARQGNGNALSGPDFTYNNPDNLENSDYKFPSRNIAFFAENLFNITRRLRFTPGIRVENIYTQSIGYYRFLIDPRQGREIYSEKIFENKTVDRSFPLLGMGLSYDINEYNQFYTNATQNYRSITFSDLRINNLNFKLDSNIVDEKGYNFDIGIRGSISNFINYDINFFYLAYNGRIGFINKIDPNTYIDYRFQTNVGDSRHMGIESYFEIDFIKVFGFQNKHSLNWFNNFSYTNATYTRSKNEIIIGKAVELVPAYMLRTGINYGIKDFKFSYLFSSVGMQYSDANNTTTTVPNAITGIVPAYFVMDASLQYNHKWLSIQTGCNNLSDNKYFTRRAEGYPGPGIIPSEGRNFYLTVGIKI